MERRPLSTSVATLILGAAVTAVAAPTCANDYEIVSPAPLGEAGGGTPGSVTVGQGGSASSVATGSQTAGTTGAEGGKAGEGGGGGCADAPLHPAQDLAPASARGALQTTSASSSASATERAMGTRTTARTATRAR